MTGDETRSFTPSIGTYRTVMIAPGLDASSVAKMRQNHGACSADGHSVVICDCRQGFYRSSGELTQGRLGANYWSDLRFNRTATSTDVPSTGSPSGSQGFIRMVDASFTAASEKPSPAGSAGNGAQSVSVPSAATWHLATP